MYCLAKGVCFSTFTLFFHSRSLFYLAEIVGEVGIERHTFIPFRIGSMQQVEGGVDDMLSEYVYIHSYKKGAQMVRRRCKPLYRSFALCFYQVVKRVGEQPGACRNKGISSCSARL